MKFTTSKGQYISPSVKRYTIIIEDENGTFVKDVVVEGNKKTAQNKIKELKKEMKA